MVAIIIVSRCEGKFGDHYSAIFKIILLFKNNMLNIHVKFLLEIFYIYIVIQNIFSTNDFDDDIEFSVEVL